MRVMFSFHQSNAFADDLHTNKLKFRMLHFTGLRSALPLSERSGERKGRKGKKREEKGIKGTNALCNQRGERQRIKTLHYSRGCVKMKKGVNL